MLEKISNDVKKLSIAFFLIFFGYNGVQQFLTTYFSSLGYEHLGFQSLTVIYLSFVIFYPVAVLFVAKQGLKKSMISGSVFYFMFIISLITKNPVFILLSSALLGVAATILWVGQGGYLIRASNPKHYGTNAGFFNTLFMIGSALGVLIFGILLTISSSIAIGIFAIFPLLAFLYMLSFRNVKTTEQKNYLSLLKKSVLSKTALRLSGIWFSYIFVYALGISIIPLEIKNKIGLEYVGPISSLFYILPILFSYIVGKFSDVSGRNMFIYISYICAFLGLLLVYISSSAVLLTLGIILMAMNFAIIRPITFALLGDVASKTNLEFLVALFLAANNIGLVMSLIIASIFRTNVVFLITLALVSLVLIIVIPLLRTDVKELRKRLEKEIH